jgi:uncharacterized protein (TIGR00251 family)
VRVKARPCRAEEKKAPEAVLAVRIQPRASRNGIEVRPDGSVKVRLTAPPVDGAANEALVKFLADAFGVGRSQVEIVSGHTARDKRIRIAGLNDEDVRRLLNESGK